MKYVKVHQSPHPEFLEIMLKDLQQDGISSARFNPSHPEIIEVDVKDKEKASRLILEYFDIILSLIDADMSKEFSLEDEKEYLRQLHSETELSPTPDAPPKKYSGNQWDIAKLIFVLIFYIFGGIFFTFPKIAEGEWGYLALFFAPIVILKWMATKIAKSTVQEPPHIKDEDRIQTGKRITKMAIWFFWIIAIPWVYLFINTGEVMWGSILEGNKTSLKLALDHLSPVVFIGASLYLFKIMFHRNAR